MVVMKLDQTALRARIQTLVVENDNPGTLIEIRTNEAAPLILNFGINDTTATFPIYSIAKTILAVLTLDLVNQGKLELDAEVGSYFEREIPDWLRKATLRNLLAHRSGLFDYGPFTEYHEAVRTNPSRAKGRESFIARVFEKGPQFECGKSFFYSNIGYALVREIIESRAGTGLQTLFDQKIGKPLGIKMEFLQGPSEEIMPGFSPYLSESRPDIKGFYDFSWVFHGTFRATTSDLTKLFSSIEGLVGPPAFKEMTNLYRLEFPHPLIRPSYGLGLMGDMTADFGPVYGHNGGGPGFSVAAYAAPSKNITVAAVVNRDSSLEAEKLVFETLKLL